MKKHLQYSYNLSTYPRISISLYHRKSFVNPYTSQMIYQHTATTKKQHPYFCGNFLHQVLPPSVETKRTRNLPPGPCREPSTGAGRSFVEALGIRISTSCNDLGPPNLPPPKGSSRTQRQQTQLFKLKNVNTVDKDLPGYKQ